MPHIPGLAQDASQLIPREQLDAATMAISGAVEDLVSRIVHPPSRVLVERVPASATSDAATSSSTCTSGSTSSGCSKSSSSADITMPVVLATVIPILMAAVVFLFLHRRHVRKLKEEDKDDKHRSLDFGMGDVIPKNKNGEKYPEMSIHNRGISIDVEATSPYVLPPGLQQSRESIHSMSRTMPGTEDPYRPVTMFQNGPNQPQNLRTRDDASSFTASSRRGIPMNESSQNLARNAQPMSRSSPTDGDPMENPFSNSNGLQQPPPARKPLPLPHDRALPMNPPKSPAGLSMNGDLAIPDRIASPNGLPPRSSSTPAVGEANPGKKSPPQAFAGLPTNPRPQRDALDTEHVEVPPVSPFASHEDHLVDDLPAIHVESHEAQFDFDSHFTVESPTQESSNINRRRSRSVSEFETQSHDLGHDLDHAALDPRRLTMGVRPLPPDDPSENPEQRANRIRSFYKEYFDDSAPVGKYDYDDYPLDIASYDNPLYDPDAGRFITGTTPYAEPITRRAMTPPPQGPRFRGGPRATGSGSFSSGPRAFSSASNRLPPMKPKKAAPPPAPLTVLPTPHMLKDDMIIPIDFAPPQSFNDRLRGTPPQSPKGGMMPFSPALKPAKSLVSSFDDLAIIPSPYALRKSGTFTSLDFAPPPRFKTSDTASDAGSIRSNRSGLSTIQSNAIRAGAYRLSRVPKGQVGTREDFAEALKPSWDMRK